MNRFTAPFSTLYFTFFVLFARPGCHNGQQQAANNKQLTHHSIQRKVHVRGCIKCFINSLYNQSGTKIQKITLLMIKIFYTSIKKCEGYIFSAHFHSPCM